MDRRLKSFLWRALPVLLLLVLVLPVAKAQTASSWVRRGQTAEARGDYDTAFEDYKHAYEKHPKNLEYKTHYERVRFQAAAAHVDQGRKLRAMGDPAAALTQYMRALEIDPSNQAAQQEIEETHKQQMAAPTPGGYQGEQISQQQASLKAISSMSAPIELKPLSSDPITLHMVEDAKVIYQAIGKTAGLNVLFDPDFTSKRIPVDLTNVSLDDALRIVGAIAGTFWKPVTNNTIFVAQNTRTKRTDLDNLAVQTFYLTNASQQNDANEVTTALRNLLDPSVKVYLVPSQNAIVMRATTDQLLLAQKLINDLDRTRPEVVVDVAVLEVSKAKERNLGITLPQTFGVGLQTLATANSTTSSSGTTTTTTSNSGSQLSLNDLGNLNAQNFAVSVSTATANLLLNDSNTRVLQNPRIRATDGQRATLKIGSKIPVATGSYSAGTAATTVSLGVQTQFQYLDVGVNIDMTPTVHYDRQISLKMKIEISTQSGQTTISGVTEPIISQRVIEQQIQLREGEPSILAGLLEQDNSAAVSGLPGLGELPLLKYFFSSNDKKNNQDEIVFLLIPHIVREQVLSPLNTRAVDTGTNQEIELRRTPVTTVDDDSAGRNLDSTMPGGLTSGGINPPLPSPNRNMTASAAANVAVAGMSQQARGGMTAADAATTAIGQMQQQAAQDTGAGATLALNVMPPESTQTVGSTFQMAVMAGNARDVFSVPMQVQFNPAVLQLVNVDAGEMLGRDGQAVALVHRDDGAGLVTITASRPPNVAGVSGQGSICTLTFRATGSGDAKVSLVKVGAKNSAQGNIAAVGSQATVHVK
ncbi:MAG: cohesin domain-containing protein [Acidobacteriaceae bacterium]|jgi:general secretion pathway protein D|nr:cohesin domain-containing protein [Acidobacteriaceae bacterium]